MNQAVKIEIARDALVAVIDEWWDIAEADDNSDKIGEGGKLAHLGRINEAGERALRELKEVAPEEPLPPRVPAHWRRP